MIPEEYMDLFEKRAFAHLATTMPDGTPQITPVWVDYADGFVLINSAKGRQKDRNLRERPYVAIAISDPDDPYRYVQIRGEVVEIIEAGGDEHINKLSLKYQGTPWVLRPNQVRVIYKIKPHSISGE